MTSHTLWPLYYLCLVVESLEAEGRIQVRACVIPKMIKIELTAIFAELHIKHQSKGNTMSKNMRSSCFLYYSWHLEQWWYNSSGWLSLGVICSMYIVHYTVNMIDLGHLSQVFGRLKLHKKKDLKYIFLT